jgi:hypothetical protein
VALQDLLGGEVKKMGGISVRERQADGSWVVRSGYPSEVARDAHKRRRDLWNSGRPLFWRGAAMIVVAIIFAHFLREMISFAEWAGLSADGFSNQLTAGGVALVLTGFLFMVRAIYNMRSGRK